MDFICCLKDLVPSDKTQHDWLGWLVGANKAMDNYWLMF